MEKQKSENEIIFYCDGGSRGNPGPAAIGVFLPQFGKEYSKFLGKATNNEAEYQAYIFGLKKIKQLIGKKKAEKVEVEIRSDSELLVNQLNGNYKIKEEKLIPFFIEIWNLKQDFKKVYFVYVPREENKKADALVNRELDNQESSLF
ncbi:ribonuclease HI family protein [Candidatus Wolfebacteria bacterium]|nr:ribonuclease HI family protein [Candidatus Wolfebacteria bacterium]